MFTGITYRQLDYWARTDLIRPSVLDEGTQRRYSYRDLVELTVVKGLLDAGVSLHSARGAIEYLHTHLGEDIGAASLIIHGSGSVLARSERDIAGLVRRSKGVLSIVTLQGVVDEIDAAVREIEYVGPSQGAA